MKKLQRLLDLVGRKKSLVKEVPEEILKQIFHEIPKLEERLSEGEMALLEKKRLEVMCKDRRYAKMEEWRKKFAAEGAVTRTAGSGSQTSDMEAELLSTEMEDRKEEMGLSKNQYMEDMAAQVECPKWKLGKRSLLLKVTRTAGSGSRTPEIEAERMFGEVTNAKSEDNERVLPMEEARDCSQKSKDVEEVTAVKDAQSTEVEGGFVACEIGGELQPVRVKAPPQKRRTVIRVD